MKSKKILIIAKSDPRINQKAGGITTHLNVLFEIFKNIGLEYDIFVVEKITDIIRLKMTNLDEFDYLYFNISIYDKGLIKLLLLTLASLNKDVIVQFHGGRFSNLRFKFLHKNILKFIYQKVDKLLVLCDDQLNELQEAVNKEEKFLKIPNFMSRKIISNRNIKLKNKFEMLKVLYIGRISKRKGIFDVIEAFKYIDNNEVQLNIVGAGQDDNLLKKIIKNDSRINYLGKKFGEDKYRILRNNHLFILASYSEGFPYSLLEAMTFKMPIIATNTGGISEMLINDYNGYFIKKSFPKDIADKIKIFTKNKRLIKIMGENSFRLVNDKFSIQKGIQTYKSLFNDIGGK